MDNIIFEKIWQDDDLIELKITAISEFATAYQNCYIQDTALKVICSKILEYSHSYNQTCYIEFGEKNGNFTPAFSMDILEADSSGHMKIEVDIEIADIDDRSHRCRYYVNGELGAIERFGHNINKLISGNVGDKINLFN